MVDQKTKNMWLKIFSFFPLILSDLFVVFLCSQAGSTIPSVSLFVVNLYGPAHTLEMTPPDSLRAR